LSVREAVERVGWYLREVSGEGDYARYLAHRERHHPDEPVLCRRDFERRRMDDRDTNPRARCC
jgi:uncharacterized short protein YbdD (DUF466 family)